MIIPLDIDTRHSKQKLISKIFLKLRDCNAMINMIICAGESKNDTQHVLLISIFRNDLGVPMTHISEGKRERVWEIYIHVES